MPMRRTDRRRRSLSAPDVNPTVATCVAASQSTRPAEPLSERTDPEPAARAVEPWARVAQLALPRPLAGANRRARTAHDMGDAVAAPRPSAGTLSERSDSQRSGELWRVARGGAAAPRSRRGALVRGVGLRRSTTLAPRVLLITDPGPDPDDIKALLVLKTMHSAGTLNLVGVVANGGGQPAARARLARVVLDTLGATAVPVAVGSAGKEYASMPHEYRLEGYDVDGAMPLERGDELIERALRESPPASLIVVCISSLRDVADAIRKDAKLVRERVCRVAIMGGLDASATSPYGYEPDTSVNNEFDREAARLVYDWCFAQGVPMSVVSRHAVPMLPMQLARSFAERTACPVMRYLADAQFLGLEGLWQKLCDGKLPARCSKQWYFETFCGVGGAEFAAQRLGALGADDPIIPRLNGFVKPYDVVALLAALPTTLGLFDAARAEVVVRAADGTSCAHLLLLGVEHMLGVEHVQRILRETYHEVVLASSGIGSFSREKKRLAVAPTRHAVQTPTRASRCDPRATRSSGAAGANDEPDAEAGRHSFGNASAAGNTIALLRLRGSCANGRNNLNVSGFQARLCVAMRGEDGLLELNACARLLLRAQLELRRHELAIYRQCAALLALATSALLGLALWGAQRAPVDSTSGEAEPVAELGQACALVAYPVALATVAMLQPIRTHRWALRAAYALILLAIGLIALLNFSRLDREALRACADDGARAADGCASARASILRLCVGGAHALAALALALSSRAVERAPETAQRRLWLACGCHFAVRAAERLTQLAWLCDPRQPCARAYAAELATGAGVLKLALVLELALLVALTAWPGSLARARAASARLIARLASRRSARACAATSAPLGLTALLNVDYAASDTRLDGVAEEVGERLRGVRASPSALGAIDFKPAARALLARATAQDEPAATGPRAAGVRHFTHRLRTAFAQPARLARARVQPVVSALAVDVVAPPIIVTDAPPLSPPPSLPRKPRLWLPRRSIEAGPGSGGARVVRPRLLDLAPGERVSTRGRLAFDFYVVHSWSDDPALKASALAQWAAGYGLAHDGREPRLWLDALCADATRTEAEQLADLPFVMSRARALLLLCGPKTLDTLRCAVELYVWLATGGSVDDVHIALVGPPSIYPQLIAAFDIYHVMYARAAADASDPSVVERLVRVVERARVSVFNEKVRSLLPVVREHAARARAQAEALQQAADEDATLSRIDSERALGERRSAVLGAVEQPSGGLSRARSNTAGISSALGKVARVRFTSRDISR